MNIEGAGFDARKYVVSLLRDSSVKQLIRRNNELDEEIRAQDHEIQSLIFENYSKFISSIDTVRQMKDNVSRVDGRLLVLERAMDRVATLALKIDAAFSVKRREIQKLDTINKDLQKLRNLCEFPAVLRQDLADARPDAEPQSLAFYDALFARSVHSYQACFRTLLDFRDEPLIAPIYKESLDKVEAMRAILRAHQVALSKARSQAPALRSVTRKLLAVAEDQVSVLRVYLHGWKDRLAEPCFLSEKVSSAHLPYCELVQLPCAEANPELWHRLAAEFAFIAEEVATHLTLSPEEFGLHIAVPLRDMFACALGLYCDAAPLHCASLRAFTQATAVVCDALQRTTQLLPPAHARLAEELRAKAAERLEQLAVYVLGLNFQRMKTEFVKAACEVKKAALGLALSEESSEDVALRGVNPLKESLTNALKVLVDDLEHFNPELTFAARATYEAQVYAQVGTLLKLVCEAVTRPAHQLSEELCQLLNPGYSPKFAKPEKLFVEGSVCDLKAVPDSGGWFAIAHAFLATLAGSFGRKIPERFQKQLRLAEHELGPTWKHLQACAGRSLEALANFYVSAALACPGFEAMADPALRFVEVLNLVFAESKRGLVRKPSFLSSDHGPVHETEILSAKKMPVRAPKLLSERAECLSYFVRRALKTILTQVRAKGEVWAPTDIFCFAQLCFEMSCVEDESVVCAFYQLILAHLADVPSKHELAERYAAARKTAHAAKPA